MTNKHQGFILPLLVAIIGILLIGGGAYVYVNRESNIPKDNSVNTTTAATTSTSSINLQSVPITPTVETSKVYVNSSANYSISYPSSSKIVATDQNCVSIKVNYGYILINSGASQGPCGPTGVGIGNVRTNDSVTVNNKQYASTGFVGTDLSSSFLSFSLNDKIQVTYGVNTDGFGNKKLSQNEYDKEIKSLKDILSTFKLGVVASQATTVQSATTTNSLIQLIYPIGGETFNPGQKVTIKWATSSFSAVNIQVVANIAARCLGGYTNNGSGGSCRGYSIYGGPNTGSYTWTVPSEYPDSGNYMIRIWPDIGMGEAQEALSNGYTTSNYSGYFTITN